MLSAELKQLHSRHVDAEPMQRESRSGFAGALEAQAAPAGDAREKARDAAEKLIASAFIIPYLSSIRETSFGEGPFAPNIVERRFGPIIDQQVADRIMQSTNFDLVDTIVDRYPQLRTSDLDSGPAERLSLSAEREWTA